MSRAGLAGLYQELVDSRLVYKVTSPEEEFFTARPQIIDMNSLYFSDLISHRPMKIREAMSIEFKNNDRK